MDFHTSDAKKEIVVDLPHGFKLRDYQIPVFDAVVNQGKKHIVIPAHRRSGKDLIAVVINGYMCYKRIGNYYHIFPHLALAKEVIWEGFTNEGIRFTDHIHPDLVSHKSKQDLAVVMKNGSRYSLRGAADVNKSVGTNALGITFSEYTLMNTRTRDYMLPIINMNDGFMLYIYTPRGRNHGFDLMMEAKRDIELYGKTDSKYALFIQPISLTGCLTDKQIEEAKRQSDKAIFDQEYMCNFNASLSGSYYEEHIEVAEKQGRIGDYPYNPEYPVNTAWDLGHSDSTSIVFFQTYNEKVYVIDYYEEHGKNLEHYANLLKDKPYKVYERHFAPHDIKVKEYFHGKTRLETARDVYGIDFVILDKWELQDGFEAVREHFDKVHFNVPDADNGNVREVSKQSVKRLVRALKEYKKDFDEQKGYSSKPVKDWTSHPADAFRYMAMSLPSIIREKYGKSPSAVSHLNIDWNPFDRIGVAKNENNYLQDTDNQVQIGSFVLDWSF